MLYFQSLKCNKPYIQIKEKINQSVLIVGSDISSIIAADNLAKQSIKVHLVQPSNTLNIDLSKIIHSSQIPIEELRDILTNYKKNQLINVYEQNSIVSLTGYAGNFDLILEDKNKNQTNIKVGSIIISVSEQAPTSIGSLNMESIQ
jgi:heterodisulfide reductase subunit A-like polyferredoxin